MRKKKAEKRQMDLFCNMFPRAPDRWKKKKRKNEKWTAFHEMGTLRAKKRRKSEKMNKWTAFRNKGTWPTKKNREKIKNGPRFVKWTPRGKKRKKARKKYGSYFTKWALGTWKINNMKKQKIDSIS